MSKLYPVTLTHSIHVQTQWLIFSATGPTVNPTSRMCELGNKGTINKLFTVNTSFRLYQKFITATIYLQIDGSEHVPHVPHVPLLTSNFNNVHTLKRVSTVTLS